MLVVDVHPSLLAICDAVVERYERLRLCGVCEKVSTRGRVQERTVLLVAGEGGSYGTLHLVDQYRRPVRALKLVHVYSVLVRYERPGHPMETLLQLHRNLNQPDLLLRWPESDRNSYECGAEALAKLLSVCPPNAARISGACAAAVPLRELLRTPADETPSHGGAIQGRRVHVARLDTDVDWGLDVSQSEQGVIAVSAVTAGSAAEKAGVLAGMYMLRVNGKGPFNSVDEVSEASLEARGAGKPVVVEFCNCAPYEFTTSVASLWAVPKPHELRQWVRPTRNPPPAAPASSCDEGSDLEAAEVPVLAASPVVKGRRGQLRQLLPKVHPTPPRRRRQAPSPAAAAAAAAVLVAAALDLLRGGEDGAAGEAAAPAADAPAAENVDDSGAALLAALADAQRVLSAGPRLAPKRTGSAAALPVPTQ